MTTQPEALRLADALDGAFPEAYASSAAAELRRLHAANSELLEALKLALFAHGKILLSDPPQEAWKTYRVEEKARAAIAKHGGAA
jgi:restriction endonuclease S subunit